MPAVIKTSVRSLGSGELCYLGWEREVQAGGDPGDTLSNLMLAKLEPLR